jgi:hypothetical protein
MMQAFHNDPEVKEKYLSRVRAHAAADELIKGTYWQEGRGCAVGCTVHSSDHSAYERELGIPEWLARVEDRIFEGLPLSRAKLWPEQFLTAIQPGADLDKVKNPFLIFILESALGNFNNKKFPDVKKAVDRVIELLRVGGSSEDFTAAARAAWEAARAAAAEAAWAAEAAAWAAEAAWEAAAAAAAAWEAARAAEAEAAEKVAD